MKTVDRILWLRERVTEQRNWLYRCGGDLAGYIAHYGDPGVAPLENGIPKVLHIPDDHLYVVTGYLNPVPHTTNVFFAAHSGDGGTKIYEADFNRLTHWEQELREVEMRNRPATLVADEQERNTSTFVMCQDEITVGIDPIWRSVYFTYSQNGPLSPADVKAAFCQAVESLPY